ncbi:MAG: hypothetical protein Q9192_009089, partial [Flavoplaca navasiana]
RKANIDTSTARPSTSRVSNKGKEPTTLPAITRKRRAKEHGHDIHTPSAGPSSNKRRKVDTPISVSPYAPTASPSARVRFEGIRAGEKKEKGGRGLGLDGGYWDLTAVGDRVIEDGVVKIESKGDGNGARRSGRVTRKRVRFQL